MFGSKFDKTCKLLTVTGVVVGIISGILTINHHGKGLPQHGLDGLFVVLRIILYVVGILLGIVVIAWVLSRFGSSGPVLKLLASLSLFLGAVSATAWVLVAIGQDRWLQTAILLIVGWIAVRSRK